MTFLKTLFRRKIIQREPSPSDMKNVATVILGGGSGTRLFPLTLTRCKPAISFGGRFRLIDIPISNALNSGCNKIYIISQYLSASLHQHVLSTYRVESFLHGFIELLSAEQKPSKNVWYQGTADAVRQNIDYLSEAPVDYFLILSGDQLYHMQFKKMLEFAKMTDAELVIAALPVQEERQAKRMGLLKVDESGFVYDFAEKPEKAHELEPFRCYAGSLQDQSSFLGSMGIYLFKREALFRLLREDAREDFGKHLIPTQVKRGGVAAYVHEGYWEDIGTIESFYQANINLTRPEPVFDCHSDHFPIYSANHYLPGPKLHNTQVCHSIISEGAIVGAKEISNSILGARTLIGRNTVIESSYVMGNDHYAPLVKADHLPEKFGIGEDCVIRKAIIDKNVCIGNNVQLINKDKRDNYDGKVAYIRSGIIVIPRGATLPDNFVL